MVHNNLLWGKKVPTFLIFVYKITVVQRLKIFYLSWLFVSWNSVFSYFKFLIYQNNPFSNKNWLWNKIFGKDFCSAVNFLLPGNKDIPFLIWTHSMQGWKATMRHGITRKRSTKQLKHTGTLFRESLQLRYVC